MKKLPNAPLQEVVFEVRWELSPDQSGQYLIDPNFDFALGKFHDLVQREFPVTKSKFPKNIPHQVLNHQTIYQFWSGEREWPVLQIGPGILSINETEKNYIWEETYYPLVKTNLQRLQQAYQHLTFTECSLRYIDVVRVADYKFTDWESFITSHLNFQFANQFDTKGSLKNFQFDQSFDLGDLGNLSINLSNGQNNRNEDIFVWQTTVAQQSKMEIEEVLNWLNEAHQCTSEIFRNICQKDFYESFIQ